MPETSTRTFVFTDIEGSTRMLRELGAAYRTLLVDHDRLIAAATLAEGGRVFGSEGDAQNLVFDEPAAAVRAALTTQRALRDGTWPEGRVPRVRMGVHTGEVHAEGADFVGMTLHETARISAAAHGGQILLSPATAELVRDRLPAGVDLLDLGEYELKDIETPTRLFQVCTDDLPREFPALRARAHSRVRLPRPVTSFVPRPELDAVVELSTTTRLLTLTGPGGTGKTRLAIAAAERIAGRFDEGTWFVALEAIREPGLVASELATTLGVPPGADEPLDRLVSYLAERSVLLVMDNLEQVADAGSVVAHIIKACPGVMVLATSRSPLRVYGEQEFPVPALPLPTAAQLGDTARLADVASVKLFEQRARAARPSFALDDANAADVADIVARLDGLPLAIELAAARVRMLPPGALRRRLDDRLGTLSQGTRDLPGRQQTLRGTIAWSHELLDAPDQRLFARLGAFAGPVTAERAEEIVGGAEEIGRDVLDGLESLLEQSLLRQLDEDADELRFTMLATIREFAREQLEVDPAASLVRRRHAAAYVALAESAAPGLTGPEGATWGDRLEREHDELRTALDWIVAHDEAQLGLRMIAAVWRFWQFRGHLVEAERRADAVLTMPSVAEQPAELRARAESAAGGIAYWRSDHATAHRHYLAALEAARLTDDRALLASALYEMGWAPVATPGLDINQLIVAGGPYMSEAMALFEELGDQGGLARTSWSLAIGAGIVGDVERARTLVRQSLAAARAVGDAYQTGWSLHTLGQSDVAIGDLDAAARHVRESLDMWVEAGDLSGVTLGLLDAVMVARARDRQECAWRLTGAHDRLREETGTQIGDEAAEFPGLMPPLVPTSEQERTWFEAGRAMSFEDSVQLAREVALAGSADEGDRHPLS